MRRRSIALPTAALVAAACAAGASGCASSVSDNASGAEGPRKVTTTGGDASKVTLRVGVQKDGIRSILAASGALKGVPYKIDWSIFAFGPPLVEAAGADKIDVAGVGDTPPIFGAAGGSDFRVIATERFDNRKDDTLLVPKGSDITDPKQLKGKTIAVPKGSSAHGFTLRLLDRLGLKQSDVRLSFLAPADGLAAFSSGKVDAWAVWEPYVTQAEEAGARGIAGGQPDEDGWSFEIASTKAVEDPNKAAALKDYISRLQRAFAWARTHQNEWADAWAKESGLPQATTRAAVPKRLASFTAVTPEATQFEQSLADTLTKHQVIPKKVDFSSIVTTGLVPAA
ncbi:ABC transporter substrate-binding protein [Conexibacter woesei]|uniref:ABC transporter substrate-binding protein n=1 Tax=Conexibacter woesei TaxID=191495 RepID=UPI0003F87444|nr:ABC transporter substrate-binding protein [Conexibacter woesei]